MAVLTITAANYDDVVLKADKPVLVDFWASWCGPCRMMSPIVDALAEERDDIIVGKINVDNDRDLAARNGVISIPTLIVYQDGTEYARKVGATPRSELLEMLP